MSPQLMVTCLLLLTPVCALALPSGSLRKETAGSSHLAKFVQNLQNKVRQARQKRSYLDNRVDTFPEYPVYHRQRQHDTHSRPDLHMPAYLDPLYDLAGISDFDMPRHRDVPSASGLDLPFPQDTPRELDLHKPLDLSILNARAFQDEMAGLGSEHMEEDRSPAHRPLDLSLFSLPELQSPDQREEQSVPDLHVSSILPVDLDFNASLPTELTDKTSQMLDQFLIYLKLKESGALDSCLNMQSSGDRR